MRNTVRKSRVTAVAVVCAALVGAGCGSGSTHSTSTEVPAGTASAPSRGPGYGKPAVTLGTKNFTEELVLGELYAQALRAKGFAVSLKSNIGASEVVARDLAAGRIDGYPEYTGTILSVLAHDSRRPADAAHAYTRAAAYERAHGAALLAMAPAEDKDVLISQPAYARSKRLRSVGDLARLGSSATLAAPPEFRTRFDGMVGLRLLYGVDSIRFDPVKIGTQYEALAQGRAQVIAGFTTDGELSQGHYTLLSDPRNIFGFQNVAFVVRSDTLRREGSAFAQTLDAVSAKLSTQALRVMNAAVDLDQQAPAMVARQFLAANGLI